MLKQEATKLEFFPQATRPADSNAKTIDAYNHHVQEYVDATASSMSQHQPEVREWVDTALETIPYSGQIFEIGSATPRDAAYMRSRGYHVTCSDGAIGFVEYLNHLGEPAQLFNVLQDTFPGRYNMIFANAVFPHFTSEEMRFVFSKIRNALSDRGTLAFTIKYGDGEEWISEKIHDERFTHYWKKDDLFELLHQTGFEIIFENSNVGKLPSHKWLNIVARRP
jgi:hypothetical protein